jgi:hypothetical protein
MLYDHKEVQNENTHWFGNVSIFKYSLYVARAKRFTVGNFLVSMVLVCVDSSIIMCGLLWLQMPGG